MNYDFDRPASAMREAAESLLISPDPQRRALGRMVKQCGDACWAIYKVDEGDRDPESATDAINEALGENAKALILAELVEQAKEIAAQLDAAIKETKKVTA